MKNLLFALLCLLMLASCATRDKFYGDSGEISDHFSSRDFNDVVRRANALCASKGMGRAYVEKTSEGCFLFCSSEYDKYSFRCQASPYSSPAAQQYQQSQPDNVGIDEAKQKCTALGFKQGSQSFGNCVLKLTK